ncbi:YIP1 family protein [bacterium]|nr:YIP1 family protein [bacterium]
MSIFQVMVKPRRFVSKVPKKNIGKIPLYLAWVIGMVFLLTKAATNHFDLIFGLPTILIASAILAIPVGFILVYLLAFFLEVMGKFFSGKASYKELITACIYGRVPEIFLLVTWGLLILYFGDNAFSIHKVFSTGSIYISVILCAKVIFFVWEIIASLQGVAQMQKFSAWMSLWSYLTSFVLVLITTYIFDYFVVTFFALDTAAP